MKLKARWKLPENTSVKIEAKEDMNIFIYIAKVASEIESLWNCVASEKKLGEILQGWGSDLSQVEHIPTWVWIKFLYFWELSLLFSTLIQIW